LPLAQIGHDVDSMEEKDALKDRIKTLLVENLMLQVSAAEIGDETPLFGPGGLGLDSVDALQIVVALDKNFGLKIPDPAAAKQILQSVNSITDAVQQKLAA
jgi:acyl carrier protein